MAALCDKRPCVIAVTGPTACGKTRLGVQLAKRLNGEIISADSMQIYKGLDIGTAKATEQEMQGVAHHLLDIIEPDAVYSVADFCRDAGAAAKSIAEKGKLPLLVGGTGLYLQSFLEGVSFAQQNADPAVREALQQKLAKEGPGYMHRQLQRIDPEFAAGIHENNTVRVLRALEIYQTTGLKPSAAQRCARPSQAPYRYLVLVLYYKEREELYQRINHRVDIMLQTGLLEEAALVYQHRQEFRTAANAIGYKEFFPYFEGRASLEECGEKLRQASRHYAKRQLTWFRRMRQTVWLDAAAADVAMQAEALCRRFVQQEK